MNAPAEPIGSKLYPVRIPCRVKSTGPIERVIALMRFRLAGKFDEIITEDEDDSLPVSDVGREHVQD